MFHIFHESSSHTLDIFVASTSGLAGTHFLCDSGEDAHLAPITWFSVGWALLWHLALMHILLTLLVVTHCLTPWCVFCPNSSAGFQLLMQRQSDLEEQGAHVCVGGHDDASCLSKELPSALWFANTWLCLFMSIDSHCILFILCPS